MDSLVYAYFDNFRDAYHAANALWDAWLLVDSQIHLYVCNQHGYPTGVVFRFARHEACQTAFKASRHFVAQTSDFFAALCLLGVVPGMSPTQVTFGLYDQTLDADFFSRQCKPVLSAVLSGSDSRIEQTSLY